MPDTTPSLGPVDLAAAMRDADELIIRARQAVEFLRAGHPDSDDMAVHDLFLAKILDGLVAAVRDRDRGIEALRAMAGRAESLRDAAIRRAEAAEHNDREIRKHLRCRIEAADRNAAERDKVLEACLYEDRGYRRRRLTRTAENVLVIAQDEITPVWRWQIGGYAGFETSREAAEMAVRRTAGLEGKGGSR